MSYSKLLEKAKIGPMRVKSRVAMPAMATGFPDLNGEASDRLIRYHEERAKGGVGLLITEIFCVNNKHGVAMPGQLNASNPLYVRRLRKLADAVHKYDTRILGQIHHGGNTNSELFNPEGGVVSSSNIPTITGVIPRPLTTEEVESLIQDFVNAAVVIKAGGFDGVELHGAHGYLISQFMAEFTNKRTDKYGGSFENRMRFAAEIYQGVRAACGKDFCISLRMNGEEFLSSVMQGTITLEEAKKIAVYFEKLGIDMLNITCSTYFSSYTAVEPFSYAQGWRSYVTKGIKDCVSIPVIGTNTIKDPDFAEKLLEDGICDMVCLGRGSLSDPEFVKKAAEGRSDEIRKCIGCIYCFESLISVGSIQCAINPRLGCELTYDKPEINGAGKPVSVIGGGPGGMQAAITLAERGYKVTLFDKGSQLGGTLNLADKASFKDKITALRDTMARQMEVAGVTVKLNTEATPELVAQEKPVAVFLATGAKPIVPSIPGADMEKVYLAEDIISGKVKLSGHVAIIGSGNTGLETAEMLIDQGCTVSIVEMVDTIGPGIYPIILMDIMQRIDKGSPEKLPGHKLCAVTDDGVTLTKMSDGSTVNLKADYVVMALGVKPATEIVDAFDAKFDRVIVIGDANRSGRIFHAIKEGYTLAYGF